MTSRVRLITISYNSACVIEDFLRHVPANIATVVVDNASRDGSAARARAAGAEVVQLDANIGYGAACNAGAAATKEPFLIFANPDIRFTPEAVEALIATAEEYPRAAFNPLIRSGSRKVVRRRSRLLSPSEWVVESGGEDRILPVLSGACMFIRRAHFELVGGFDPAIFLFHEDDDLSLRLRKAGVELRLTPAAVVHHAAGTSSGRSPEIGRMKGDAMARSLVYVMRKHGLWLDLAREYRKARVRLFWPHVFLVPSRRAKHLAFVRGLRRSLDELRNVTT